MRYYKHQLIVIGIIFGITLAAYSATAAIFPRSGLEIEGDRLCTLTIAPPAAEVGLASQKEFKAWFDPDGPGGNKFGDIDITAKPKPEMEWLALGDLIKLVSVGLFEGIKVGIPSSPNIKAIYLPPEEKISLEATASLNVLSAAEARGDFIICPRQAFVNRNKEFNDFRAYYKAGGGLTSADCGANTPTGATDVTEKSNWSSDNPDISEHKGKFIDPAESRADKKIKIKFHGKTLGKAIIKASFDSSLAVNNSPNLSFGNILQKIKDLFNFNRRTIAGVIVESQAELNVVCPSAVLEIGKPKIDSFNLAINETKQLSAWYYCEGRNDPNPLDVTNSANWDSNAPSIAQVGNTNPTKGLVTGKKAGQTQISAEYLGAPAAVQINVLDLNQNQKDFALTAEPQIIRVSLGRTGQSVSSKTTVKVIPSHLGFDQDVILSLKSGPVGSKSVWNNQEVDTITLTPAQFGTGAEFQIKVPASTPINRTYTVVIKGVGASIEKTVSVDLEVKKVIQFRFKEI